MEEALTALLASIAGGRRFWVRAPASAPRPFLVLNRIDGVPSYQYSGANGYIASRVQIDIYANTYTETKTIARAVKALLSGYSGGNIQAIFVENEGRDLPAADAGDVTNLFRTSIDIVVHHQA
ncbi:MAG: DUF3168 domain-containing protein [Mesorhizobium sp.]|nr:MAG: DUF3168 domain-containing protein [Mesorhizobium sp.]